MEAAVAVVLAGAAAVALGSVPAGVAAALA